MRARNMWKEMLKTKSNGRHFTALRVSRETKVLKDFVTDEINQEPRYSHDQCCTCQRGPPGPPGEPGVDGQFDNRMIKFRITFLFITNLLRKKIKYI